MMLNRETLQVILEHIAGKGHVYFQPPTNLKMQYPAIVYAREGIDNAHADDIVYKQNIFYQITVIDKDPDSRIVQELSLMPLCRHDRHFTSDNLNHDVFTLYY